MRHLLLVLMIALLPVRGWVGDVMATGMAASHAAQFAPKVIAKSDSAMRADDGFDHVAGHQRSAQVMPDCAGHHGADEDTAQAQGPGDFCSFCQVCHSVALSPPAVAAAMPALSFTPPLSPVATFASAETAPDQKPPIS